MDSKIRRIAYISVLSALAFVVVYLIRIPAFGFLTYDPKDVVIVLGGFLFGPLAAVCSAVVVALLEMLSASDTGIIGFAMSASASVAFVLPAVLVYSWKKTQLGALLGLVLGGVVMTAVMLALNLVITPLFLGVPRQAVIDMIVPVLLPFNLLKAAVNAALALVLYWPVTKALGGIMEGQSSLES